MPLALIAGRSQIARDAAITQSTDRRSDEELASTGQPLVATHVSFPAAGRVSVTRDVFRWVPAYWAH